MHELTLFAGLVRIITDEMKKSGLARLTRVRLTCGALAGLAPGAMRFAWEVLTQSGPLEGAKLLVEVTPLRLRCGDCGQGFEPEAQTFFAPCPACGQDLGHAVLSGRELFIESIEGEVGVSDPNDGTHKAAA